MQIPKSLILCAAICLCPLLIRADSEAQARAREALRGKIAELDGAAAPNATPAAATETKPLPVAPAPAPVPKVKLAPAPTAAPSGTTRTATKRLDPETRRMANEKLQEKIRELEAQSSPPKKHSSTTESDATEQAREQLRRKVAELTPTETKPSETVVAKPTPIVEQPVAKPTPPKAALTSAKSDGQIDNAREALRKKIAEIETQKPVATSTPAPTPPTVVAAPTPTPTPPPVVAAPTPAPVPRPEPAPILTPPPVIAQLAPTAPPVVSKPTPTPAVSPGAEFAAVPAIPDSVEISKAREGMRKRIAELESQPKPLESQPKPSPTQPKLTAPVPPAKPNASFEPVEGIAPGTSAIAIYEPEKTRAKDLSAKERARMEAERAAMRTPASFNTVEVPPPAISAAKAEKLAELLRTYKVDEITPEQYHKERAKILAEP